LKQRAFISMQEHANFRKFQVKLQKKKCYKNLA
jgi:hypothetical protein